MKIILLFLPMLFIGQFGFSQVRNDIEYDLSCLDSDLPSTSTSFFGDLENGMLNAFGTTVSIQEEISSGQEFLTQSAKNYKFIKSGEKIKNIEGILSKLNKVILNPKGFNYKIFLIDSTVINAFTVGGNIFFTTGMYEFCKNNNEIACIIGHEISHNELGHINDHIKRSKTANTFLGDNVGGVSSNIGALLITPFNQKDEAHCDLLGIDLAYAAGFEACSNVELWKRMSLNEGGNSNFTSLFSSHPYSLKRSDCSKRHIETNYKIKCEE
jgi:predicted Zn-dependent protease